jgi:hypothetical protein
MAPVRSTSSLPSLRALLTAATLLAGCGGGVPVERPDGGQGGGEESSGAGGPTAALDGGGDAVTRAADAGEAQDAGAPLPPMVMPEFIVGYNEAWFGPWFGTGLTSDFDPAYARSVLDGIKLGGGRVVRLFLFELGQGLVLAPSTPRTQGVSPQLLANLEWIITEARQRGLWVYLTALESNHMALYAPLTDYYRALLTNTSGEGDAFNALVLGPLLEMLDRHAENVFGLDLANELDAAKSDGMWSGLPLDPVGPRAFVQRTRDFIRSRSPWLRVTVTLGKGGTAQYDLAGGFLSGLGLDFYDVHLYSDNGTFGGMTALCDRAALDGVPLYLGEFGQKTQAWNDTLHYAAAANFLNGAKTGCFKGALAWRFDAAEETWAYQLPDGGLRPAAQVIQAFSGP